MPTDEPAATTAPPAWTARLRERFRRPEDLVGRTRWLFALCSAAALVVAPAVITVRGGLGVLPLVLVAGAVVADLVDASLPDREHAARSGTSSRRLAVLVLATASPDPAAALQITFPGTWYRAVYGTSTTRAMLYTVGLLAAVLGAVPLRLALDAAVPVGTLPIVLGTIPVALLTTVVAHHLTVGLVTKEQSQRRDAALATLSADLLGPDLLSAGNRGAIRDRGWIAVETICAATPGLCALVVIERPDRLEVTRHAGPLADVPVALPLTVLPPTPRRSGARARSPIRRPWRRTEPDGGWSWPCHSDPIPGSCSGPARGAAGCRRRPVVAALDRRARRPDQPGPPHARRPGAHRRAVRTGQPDRLLRRAHRAAGAARPGAARAGRPVPRPRRLQDRQRRARPRGR